MIKYCIFGLFLLSLTLYAQWEPDQRLTLDRDSSITSFNNVWCVAASGAYVHVVWSDHRTGLWQLFYKRSTDAGTSWGADTRLTNSGVGAGYPCVAVTGANVHVTFMDGRDLNPEIYYKRSTDDGATWGSDMRLTNDNAYSLYPSVAVSSANVHAVWEDERDGNQEVYYKRSTDGGVSWGSDTRLTNAAAYSGDQTVAVSGTNVHVAWYDERDGNSELYYKRSTDNGASWGADQRLTNNSAWSQSPSIGVAGANVHILWDENRDGNGEVYYKRSTDNGQTWGGDIRLTTDSGWSWNPSVAVSVNNIHIVWCEDRTGNQEIYYKRSTDNGSTWTSDTGLTNASADSKGQSTTVADSCVHVVWHDERDGNWEIYYKRNPRGNPVEIEEDRPMTLNARRFAPRVFPNPFASFAIVIGHEHEFFVLYDITGKAVGLFRGDRIGEGLTPGIYFMRNLSWHSAPARIVKIR